MTTEEVKKLILEGIPDAHAEVIDTRRSGDHFNAIVVSESFENLSMVKQHQMVYKTLKGYLTNEIHALQLKTLTREQWRNEDRREAKGES